MSKNKGNDTRKNPGHAFVVMDEYDNVVEAYNRTSGAEYDNATRVFDLVRKQEQKHGR